MSSSVNVKDALVGLLGVAVVVGLVAVAAGAYYQVFTPVVRVELKADRAGLLTDPGADVRVRGVRIGEVRSVEPDPGGGVTLGLALDPGTAGLVPAAAGATLLPATVFGRKNVEIESDGAPAAHPVSDGDVLYARQVSTEIDSVLDDLVSVLETVEPAKLNVTLGAMAQALAGRGERIGDLVAGSADYLDRFDPNVAALLRDVQLAAPVADGYARSAPDLVRTLDNLRTTAGTVAAQQTQVHEFLLDMTSLSGTVDRFLGDSEGPLRAALGDLTPVSALLAEYSPMLTCTIVGTNNARKLLEPAVGGNGPYVYLSASAVQPGIPSYKYSEDLPKVGGDTGPDCVGLPLLKEGQLPAPHYDYDSGVQLYERSDDTLRVPSEPLAVYLFGPVAEEALKR